MMEKYPILSVLLDSSLEMWFRYQLQYQPKVSANLCFGFGIGPKPKQWFRSYQCGIMGFSIDRRFRKTTLDRDARWQFRRGPCTVLLVKSFIDGAADCFENRRDAERVPSAILLLANCRLVTNLLYLCPQVYTAQTAKSGDFKVVDSVGQFLQIQRNLPEFRGISQNLEESDRGIGQNLEELATGSLSIRKISENDKIATFSRLSGM